MINDSNSPFPPAREPVEARSVSRREELEEVRRAHEHPRVRIISLEGNWGSAIVDGPLGSDLERVPA